MVIRVLMMGTAMFALAACAGGETDTNNAVDNGTAATTEETAAAPDEVEDALVDGTDYNATSMIPCGIEGDVVTSCDVGVKRNWDDEGGALVEVTKPDGMTRAIFFDGEGTAFGADSAQADGSAAYEFSATREGDETAIEFGPERYVIPDALVTGG